MIKRDKAFVEVTFGDEVKRQMDEIINQLVEEDNYYYSPVMEHIRGNMSRTLHCTVYHGLSPRAKSDEDLKLIVESVEVPELKLGKLKFVDGFENLYKILMIDVDDSGVLRNLNQSVFEHALKFNPDLSPREFSPHVTLAYINNEFELPTENIFPETLKTDSVRISLVSEFNKAVSGRE